MPKFTETSINKQILIFGCAIFLLLFSGCSISQKKPVVNNNWQNEVLLADECGFDGLKCCENEEQQCKYGQSCCVNPKNNKDNYCAESCEEGKEKSFCRLSEPDCDFGLVCQSDRCLLCGGENQFCCKGQNECADNLFCHNDKCLTCGLAGHPCCPNDKPCIDSDLTDDTQVECFTDVCRDCGFSGGPACVDKPFCSSGHLENNNSCFRCGGLNQPCCSIEDKNGVCDQKEGLECVSGFCGKK